MIELKVGDKFVVRSTPLPLAKDCRWSMTMTDYCGKILTIFDEVKAGVYTVYENRETWYSEFNHIDWEATKKLHEVVKTYEWHEAIKMAAEGTPMRTEHSNNHMELYNNMLYWVLDDGTVVKPVRVHQSDMWNNCWIPYIKPITLTDDEKTILRNVDGKYKWIARDMEIETGLWVFEDKPYKLNLEWDGQNYESLDCFNHLFRQIKWEDKEPCLIADLIK